MCRIVQLMRRAAGTLADRPARDVDHVDSRRRAMVDLHELEQITRLKYRYLRCLDTKQWDELADCLTEDCRSAYGDGHFSFDGRDKIVAFLKEALGPASRITAHRVQQPEIELTS